MKIRYNSHMVVSLIICTFNRSIILDETLPSILELFIPSGISLELIVVDNNSTDETHTIVSSFISLLQQSEKRITGKYVFEGTQGLSFARNTGYKHAVGDYIAYTDDECLLPVNWLKSSIEIINDSSPAFLGGPYFGRYLKGSSSSWFMESFGDSYMLQFNLPNGPLGNRYLSGGNMLIRKDVFSKVGLFDTNLGMSGNTINYGEEHEFQKRFLNQYPGELAWYDERVFVWHLIRNEKMKLSFLLKDAFIRGRSAAEINHSTTEKLLIAPVLLIFYIFKAISSAIYKGVKSLVVHEHFFKLLYEDYKNGTWRNIGGSWYNTKKLIGL